MLSVITISFFLFFLVIVLLLINAKRPVKYPPGTLYAVPGQGVHFEIDKWRRKYGNIIGHKYGPCLEIYITGIEESLAAMKHPNFQGRKIFYHRNQGQKRGLFFNDGADWAILKRFTLNYFSEFQKIKIEDLMIDEMNELFSKIVPDSTIEINYKFFPIGVNILMKIISNLHIDNKETIFNNILTHTYNSLHDTRPTGIENYFPIIRKWFFKPESDVFFVQNFLKKCINEHKATLKKDAPRDFIDAFLIEQECRQDINKGVFTDDELISDSYDLLRAGSISTADTIALVMLYLLINPHVQNRMYKEIDENVGRDNMPTLDDRKKLPYCEAVIAESMRINPIVPFTAPHRATEDTEFYGYRIPKDTIVKVSLWTLFRDTDIWDEPDKFKPERFLANGEYFKYSFHLPFGLGKRSCLMEVMAKNMIFLYLTAFFQKYFISLPPGEPIPSTISVQGSVTGPKPFKVLIKERS